jgi:hypothetical protein
MDNEIQPDAPLPPPPQDPLPPPPQPPTEAEQLQAAVAENAALRQELQTFMAQQAAARPAGVLPKLQKPAQWDGKSDFDRYYKLPTKAYLDYFNITDTPQGVHHAAHLLPEPYFSTYQAYLQLPEAEQPQSFDAFCTLLKLWHPQGDRLEAAMDMLEDLRCQPGKLAEYTREFTVLMMEVYEHISTYWAKYRYVKGLTHQLRREINSFIKLRENSLEEIITVATAAESRLLNLSKGRAANNASFKPFFPKSSNTGASSSNSGPTPMEINRATFKGLCYKCNKPGHRAAECTAPPSEQRHLNRHGQKPSAAAPHRPAWQSKK